MSSPHDPSPLQLLMAEAEASIPGFAVRPDEEPDEFRTRLIRTGEESVKAARWDAAETCFLLALETAKQQGHLPGMAWASIYLGRLSRDRGNISGAFTLYETALDLAQRTGDQRLRATSLDELGTAHFCSGSFAKAADHHKSANEVREQIQDNGGLSHGYNNLGNALVQQGDLDGAIAAYEKSIECATGFPQAVLGILSGQGGAHAQLYQTYGNLGIAYKRKGQIKKAIEMFTQSLELALSDGDQLTSANQYGNLGNAYRECGDLKEAVQMYRNALEVFQKVGDIRNAAIIRATLRSLRG